jgi:translation initiation factor IF-2
VPTKKSAGSKSKTAASKKAVKTPAKGSSKAEPKKSVLKKTAAKSVKKLAEKNSAVKTPAAKVAAKMSKAADVSKTETQAKVQDQSKQQAQIKPQEAPISQPKPEHAGTQDHKHPGQKPHADFAEDILGPTNEAPQGEAEIYDEIISQELERELVHSQRKQMAGKDSGGKKSQKRPEFQPHKPVIDRIVEIPEVITVKEFSEKTGLGAAKVIGELMKNGILANINQQIDFDTAQIIAVDLGITIKKKRSEGTAEDVFSGNLEALLKQDEAADLQPRPPIVVVMGHVDHGKTKLLDYIRNTNVVAKEAGGITQHIGAYQVVKNDRKITFLDTPGHEAFTAMRARGAKVTDIAILVVAADEGVKPQTVEALQHAQDAGVPIIVAINKIDKENAAPERVKGELGEYGLVPEEWGGSTIMCPVSAVTGQGMDHLLEMILLVADMANLKGNPNREAVGTVIEAHLNPSLGPVVTIIVNTGTLHIGDNFVVGGTHGRVKVMKDNTGKNVATAGPSTPVMIAGLSASPQAGDIMHVVANEQTARAQALNVKTLKEAELLKKRGVGEIMSQITSGQLKQLKLVLKADTKGSLEALKQAIAQIKNEMVSVKTVLASVGNVTESDVMMAAAAGGIVMGFHVDVPLQVKRISEREHVEVLQYTIIYQLLDDIKKILTGLLEPEIVENILGRAEIKKVFMTEKKEMIVGCRVIKGHVESKAKVRVFRKGPEGEQMVGEGTINTLKSFEKNVTEVNEGNDCGIRYEGFMPLLEGDQLEAYKMEKRIRTL